MFNECYKAGDIDRVTKNMVFISSVLIVLFLCLSWQAFGDMNILTNPGFENGADASPWVPHFGSTISGVQTPTPHAGFWCGASTGRTEAYQGMEQDLYGIVAAGATYTVSGYFQTNTGDDSDIAITWKVNGNYTGHIWGTANNSGWTYIEGSYTIPAEITDEELYVYVEGPASGVDIYADDLVVYGPEVSPPNPNLPVLVAPSDGHGNISPLPTLQWESPSAYAPAGYDVYLGTDSTVTNNPVYAVSTEEFVPAEALDNETTYHWAVVAYDGATGYMSEDTWSFTTVSTGWPEFTGNNRIDIEDLRVLAGEWLRCIDPTTDVTGDGCVNMRDFSVLAYHWLWEGPEYGMTRGSKWVGNIAKSDESTVPSNYLTYWNQLTPENSTKWGSCEGTRDVMKWGNSSTLYNLCKDNKIPFKFHTLVWGSQEPGWISSLPANEQLEEVLEWYQAAAARMPDPEYIDVVNEPLHAPASYREALGGAGETGWDWVVWSFQQARTCFPNSELILNDYNIINSTSNATQLAEIAAILNDRGLIDGIGIQCHRFSMDNVATSTMNQVLGILASTGLPIYVSELDMSGDDSTQLQRYQQKFPVLFEHPNVSGITLWGYRDGLVWGGDTCHLLLSSDAERPAMVWLKEYLSDF